MSGVNSRHLERADEEVREVGGVGEPRAIELLHRVEVQVRHVGRRHHARAVVVRGVDQTHLLAEDGARALRLVLQRGDQAALQQVQRFGREVRRREREIVQLQRRLDVARRGVAADFLGVGADAGRGRGNLAGEHLAEVDRAEPADAADADQRRRRARRPGTRLRAPARCRRARRR